MNDQDLEGFFWTPLLIVTGISFLVFSEIVNFIGGPHAPLFCKLGLLCTGIGAMILVAGLTVGKRRRRMEMDN